MSEGVIKIAIICFTIICCFGFMTRAMTKMDFNTMESAKENEDKQRGKE